MNRRWAATVGLLALLTVPASSLDAQTDGSPSGRPVAATSYRVVAAAEPVRIGSRLAEPVWQRADSIVDFRQREPVQGAPATERTVVKLVRDRDRLYVAVRAYDTSMAGVRATQFGRDADLSVDDNVTVLIDGYGDRRGAFLFRTNPNGAMWDAQLTGFDNLNANWNGIWDVMTWRDSVSWNAEFAIPFSTLRLGPSNDGFGFNVRRFIRRRNEEDLWRSFGRTQGLDNLLYEGTIAGFSDVSRRRLVEARPYVLGEALAPSFDSAGDRLAPAGANGKVGLDVKLGVSATMTADLTINTDFAQVEADQQVINLTRFPTYFPEKRQFFLESSGLFDIGTPRSVQLFYSRRIGLDSTGVPVPILGGARVYGRQGPWTVGLLDVRTGGAENANDFALRVGHDLLARSTISAMVVNRSAPGRAGDDRGFAADLDLPLVVRGHNVEPHVWLMGTQTPGAAGTPLAWRISTDYPNDLFDNFVSLYRIDRGFDPTMGFARRTGIWETTGHVDFMPRPGVLGIRQLDLTPVPSWDIIADRTTGDLARPSSWETAQLRWRVLGAEFQSGDAFQVNVQRDFDAPTSTFEIFPGATVAPGRYWWTSGNVRFQSSPGRPFSLSAELGGGQLYGGRSRTAQLGATVNGAGHLSASVTGSVTAAKLPGGHFTAAQLGSRVDYAITTRADFLAFAQFNNGDQRADFYLRFHWIPTIGDDLFVVWNSGFTTDPAARWRFPARGALAHPLNGALEIKAVHRLAR